MSKKDKYGFQTTSLTMIEKLARGEDWPRFCERYYEPIKNVFNAINWKKGCFVDSVDVDDAIGTIIEKLKGKLQTSYNPKRGRLRNWLSTVIRNAIMDYWKEKKKAQESLLRVSNCTHNGADDDAVDSKTLIEDIPDKPADDDKEWMGFLAVSAMNIAEVCRPWSARDKEVIRVIKEELAKEKPDRRSDKEIASVFNITEENLRKIRSRYMAEVRKQYHEFEQDDPAFFDTMKKYNISFDALLEEYLKTVGGEEELAKRSEEFKERHLPGAK